MKLKILNWSIKNILIISYVVIIGMSLVYYSGYSDGGGDILKF